MHSYQQTLLVSCVISVFLVAFDCTSNGAEQPPNIVIILADDLGWADVGYHGHGGKPLDGLNVMPVLSGEQQELERDLFFYHGQNGENDELNALTTPKWKLVILGPNIAGDDYLSDRHEQLLFAIDKDPLEKNDVVEQHPSIVKQLARRMIEFRKLQPQNGVTNYTAGRNAFKPPKDWRISEKSERR